MSSDYANPHNAASPVPEMVSPEGQKGPLNQTLEPQIRTMKLRVLWRYGTAGGEKRLRNIIVDLDRTELSQEV